MFRQRKVQIIVSHGMETSFIPCSLGILSRWPNAAKLGGYSCEEPSGKELKKLCQMREDAYSGLLKVQYLVCLLELYCSIIFAKYTTTDNQNKHKKVSVAKDY